MIADPHTGDIEALVVRQLIEGREPMKLGGRHHHRSGYPPLSGDDRLCAFYPGVR
jgi:hypothetical protein